MAFELELTGAVRRNCGCGMGFEDVDYRVIKIIKFRKQH